MWMPLYGVILFCLAARKLLPILPASYMGMCIAGTAVLTLIIPIILLVFLWRKGYIDSLHIDNAKQRTTPYIYTLICYGFWAYFVRNSQDAYIYAIGGDRGDGRVVGSYHHQPLVENLSTSHGYRRTIRRHMQLCAQLFHPTFDADNHSITTSAITNVCTPISPCTYPYASGMWIPVGVVVYVHSYTHHDVCVNISYPYCYYYLPYRLIALSLHR